MFTNTIQAGIRIEAGLVKGPGETGVSCNRSQLLIGTAARCCFDRSLGVARDDSVVAYRFLTLKVTSSSRPKWRDLLFLLPRSGFLCSVNGYLDQNSEKQRLPWSKPGRDSGMKRFRNQYEQPRIYCVLYSES